MFRFHDNAALGIPLMCLAVDAGGGGWPGPCSLAGQIPFSSPDSTPSPSPAGEPPPSQSPTHHPMTVCMAPLPPPCSPTPPLRGHLPLPPSCLQRDSGLSVGLPFLKGANFLALLPTPTGLPPSLCLHSGIQRAGTGVSSWEPRLPPFILGSPPPL